MLFCVFIERTDLSSDRINSSFDKDVKNNLLAYGPSLGVIFAQSSLIGVPLYGS